MVNNMNYWLLTITFLSVNLDFFFMLIFLLQKYELVKVIIGYLLGVLTLMTVSYLIGRSLASFLPEWLLGALGFLPIYLAFHDNDETKKNKEHKSQILNVFITYLSVCAGCNLSIFLPVLAGESLPNFLKTLVFISVLTIAIVILIKLIANIPIVSRIMKQYGEKLMKVCYIAIGLYVFWDSGLITHLLGLLKSV